MSSAGNAPIHIGRNIARLLAERPDLSQREFARRVGVSPQAVGYWISERSEPGAATCLAICDVLHVTPWQLIRDEAAPEADPPELSAAVQQLRRIYRARGSMPTVWRLLSRMLAEASAELDGEAE